MQFRIVLAAHAEPDWRLHVAMKFEMNLSETRVPCRSRIPSSRARLAGGAMQENQRTHKGHYKCVCVWLCVCVRVCDVVRYLRVLYINIYIYMYIHMYIYVQIWVCIVARLSGYGCRTDSNINRAYEASRTHQKRRYVFNLSISDPSV